MAKSASVRARKKSSDASDLLALSNTTAPSLAERYAHRIRTGIVCKTDIRGAMTPNHRSPAEIVVDASEGFIPLWAADVTLRWRFQPHTISKFAKAEVLKTTVRTLMGKALLLWGDAVPIKFTERNDAWDFEVVVKTQDDCDASGCVLASAFFPDGGRHELSIYPKMFSQAEDEQIETLAHELGHVFGLRHFFASISETQWASDIFGTHQTFSIMNYGMQSVMTDYDRSDLKRLYTLARTGALTNINGTPIKLVHPFSAGAGNQFALPLVAAAVEPDRRRAVERARCCCCSGA